MVCPLSSISMTVLLDWKLGRALAHHLQNRLWQLCSLQICPATNAHLSVMCFFLGKSSYFATLCFFWGSGNATLVTRWDKKLNPIGRKPCVLQLLQTERHGSCIMDQLLHTERHVSILHSVTNRATWIISQITIISVCDPIHPSFNPRYHLSNDPRSWSN